MFSSSFAPFVSRFLVAMGTVGALGVLRYYPIRSGSEIPALPGRAREKLTVGFLPVT